ncbi:MAG: hypothetical protein QOH01_1332 [Verrucomicrobiota bacterium]
MVDISPITDRDEIQNVSLAIEFVDHAIIADAKSEFAAAGQVSVRVIVEARAKMMDFSFDRDAETWRQFEEGGIELARVDLTGETHTGSDSRTRTLPSVMSRLPRSMLAANSSVTSS